MYFSAIKNNQVGVKPGRKRQFTQDMVEEVRSRIHTDSLKLNAPAGRHGVHKVLIDVAKSKLKNKRSKKAFKISTSTLDKAMKQIPKLITVEKASVKNSSRSDAFTILRNSISLCAVLESVYKSVNSQLYFSSDDVSVLLNGDEKPSVITTEEARKILEEMNVSVSSTQNQQQRRVVTFNFTISPCGDRICSIIKFCDNTFVDLKTEPLVILLEDGRYLMLYHPSMKEETICIFQYKLCIIPCAIKVREKILAREKDDDESFILKVPQPKNSEETNASVVEDNNKETTLPPAEEYDVVNDQLESSEMDDESDDSNSTISSLSTNSKGT